MATEGRNVALAGINLRVRRTFDFINIFYRFLGKLITDLLFLCHSHSIQITVGMIAHLLDLDYYITGINYFPSWKKAALGYLYAT